MVPSPRTFPAVVTTDAGLRFSHLVVDDAEVLAQYEHPQLGRFPAVTTRAHGRGRVTYVGTVPDRIFGADLVRHLVPAPVATAWHRDDPVTVLSGVANATRIHFLHNWSGLTAHAVTPHGVDDLVAGVPLPGGHRLTLEPWGCVVLADQPPAARTPEGPNQRKVGH